MIADDKNDKQKASFLGPCYSEEYIENFLIKEGVPYKKLAYSDIPGSSFRFNYPRQSNWLVSGPIGVWAKGIGRKKHNR